MADAADGGAKRARAAVTGEGVVGSRGGRIAVGGAVAGSWRVGWSSLPQGEEPKEGEAYTLAPWRVEEGREERFVALWKGPPADYFLGLPYPPGVDTPVRSVRDPRRLFYSFGPLEEARRHPRDALEPADGGRHGPAGGRVR